MDDRDFAIVPYYDRDVCPCHGARKCKYWASCPCHDRPACTEWARNANLTNPRSVAAYRRIREALKDRRELRVQFMLTNISGRGMVHGIYIEVPASWENFRRLPVLAMCRRAARNKTIPIQCGARRRVVW